MSDLSIVASNCPQNLCESRCLQWNFVITSFGSLTFSLPPLLDFSMAFASNFSFCSSSCNFPSTFSYLANSSWIPKLQSFITSSLSPRPILSSLTIAFISWHSSSLLSKNLQCLWIGVNKLLPAILFVFSFASCSTFGLFWIVFATPGGQLLVKLQANNKIYDFPLFLCLEFVPYWSCKV